MIERVAPTDSEWLHCSADHLSRYMFAAELSKGRHVLDAGCGTGYGSAILKCTGASRVLGVDTSSTALDYAQTHFAVDGVDFILDDCQELSKVTVAIDLICSLENIEHLTKPEAFLRRACDLLRAEGVLVCSSPDRASTPPFIDGEPANPFHLNEWLKDEFTTLLRRYFSSVTLYSQVTSHSYLARKAAFEHLCHQWTWLSVQSPLNKASRLLATLIRRPPPPCRSIGNLLLPTPSDFPIVRAEIASVFGVPICHVAVCQR